MSFQAMKIVCRVAVLLVVVLGYSEVARSQWTRVNNPPSSPSITNPSTCLLLTDGTVMCQADEGSKSWLRLTPDNTGSYENGVWTSLQDAPKGTDGTIIEGVPCAPCQWAPTYYASAVLPDGRVVFIGGEYNTNSAPMHESWSNIGFLFDPTAKSGQAWSTQLNQPFGVVQANGDTVGSIGDAQSVITQNGTMLVAHITDSNIASFDPSTLTFTALNPTGTKDDRNDEEAWTLLPNGTILNIDSQEPDSFQIYDPWPTRGVTPAVLGSGWQRWWQLSVIRTGAGGVTARRHHYSILRQSNRAKCGLHHCDEHLGRRTNFPKLPKQRHR